MVLGKLLSMLLEPLRLVEHGSCFVDINPGTGGGRQIQSKIVPQDQRTAKANYFKVRPTSQLKTNPLWAREKLDRTFFKLR